MPIGSIDKNGVAEWNVEPILDDGCSYQDVRFVPHEGEHHLLQFSFRHLTVTDDHASTWHEFLNLGSDFIDTLHPVVDEVDLTSAFEFVFDGRANQLFIERSDDGLNRHAVFGRSFNYAHVAQPNQRHVQRAWNRGCRHSEDVHLFLQLLEAFLVTDAEALLFVDDQKSQIRKLDVL